MILMILKQLVCLGASQSIFDDRFNSNTLSVTSRMFPVNAYWTDWFDCLRE